MVHRAVVKTLSRSFLAILAFAFTFAATSARSQDRSPDVGVVYTASNASSGNEVFAFKRTPGGQLSFAQSFSTGGTGNDVALGGLGNQGGVVLGRDGHWLFVVNPGSNSLSVFSVKQNGALVLTDTEPSNGVLPTSVTISGNLVYVLNADGAGSIAGFTLDNAGNLTPIPGSIQPLSGMAVTGGAQVQFTPDGSALIVTEKATNLIDTYLVDESGVASAPTLNASAGETPFGFAFSRDGHLIVSEAFGGAVDASAVSSYSVDGNGAATVITPSEPTTETAACWIVVTNSGKFTYTTNTGSGTVSGFRINRATGQLTPLDADGVTAVTGTGSTPTDEVLTRDSGYLYVLNSAFQEIVGYRVDKSNGSLEQVASVGDLPVAAFGLAAR